MIFENSLCFTFTANNWFSVTNKSFFPQQKPAYQYQANNQKTHQHPRNSANNNFCPVFRRPRMRPVSPWHRTHTYPDAVASPPVNVRVGERRDASTGTWSKKTNTPPPRAIYLSFRFRCTFNSKLITRWVCERFCDALLSGIQPVQVRLLGPGAHPQEELVGEEQVTAARTGADG